MLYLNQSKYLESILKQFKLEGIKMCQTPMVVGQKIYSKDTLLDNPSEYRSLIRSLQYLCITRPDIAYFVNKLSQFFNAPTICHFKATKRILRYLKGSITNGLYYCRNLTETTKSLNAFTDADWGGDLADRKSQTGYCIFFGNYLMSWSSRKQKATAHSSTEAELRALATTACEII
jgi:hypothetical protein